MIYLSVTLIRTGYGLAFELRLQSALPSVQRRLRKRREVSDRSAKSRDSPLANSVLVILFSQLLKKNNANSKTKCKVEGKFSSCNRGWRDRLLAGRSSKGQNCHLSKTNFTSVQTSPLSSFSFSTETTQHWISRPKVVTCLPTISGNNYANRFQLVHAFQKPQAPKYNKINWVKKLLTQCCWLHILINSLHINIESEKNVCQVLSGDLWKRRRSNENENNWQQTTYAKNSSLPAAHRASNEIESKNFPVGPDFLLSISLRADAQLWRQSRTVMGFKEIIQNESLF